MLLNIVSDGSLWESDMVSEAGVQSNPLYDMSTMGDYFCIVLYWLIMVLIVV